MIQTDPQRDSPIHKDSVQTSMEMVRQKRPLTIQMTIRPGVHKGFQNQDQDQVQVKSSFTMDVFQTLLIITAIII